MAGAAAASQHAAPAVQALSVGPTGGGGGGGGPPSTHDDAGSAQIETGTDEGEGYADVCCISKGTGLFKAMSEVDDEEEKSGTQVAGAGNMDVEHVPLAGGFQKGDRVRGLVAHAPMNVKVGDEGTVVGPSSTYEQKSTTAEETSTVDGKTGERGGRREGAESGEGGEGGEKGGGALLVLREMLLERNPESRSTILRETLRGEAQNLEKNPESRTTNYTALPGGVKRRRVAEEEDGGGERELTTTTTTPTASSATPVRRDTQIEREGGREREPVRTMDATKAAVGEKRKLAEHFGGGGGGAA